MRASLRLILHEKPKSVVIGYWLDLDFVTADISFGTQMNADGILSAFICDQKNRATNSAIADCLFHAFCNKTRTVALVQFDSTIYRVFIL